MKLRAATVNDVQAALSNLPTRESFDSHVREFLSRPEHLVVATNVSPGSAWSIMKANQGVTGSADVRIQTASVVQSFAAFAGLNAGIDGNHRELFLSLGPFDNKNATATPFLVRMIDQHYPVRARSLAPLSYGQRCGVTVSGLVSPSHFGLRAVSHTDGDGWCYVVYEPTNEYSLVSGSPSITPINPVSGCKTPTTSNYRINLGGITLTDQGGGVYKSSNLTTTCKVGGSTSFYWLFTVTSNDRLGVKLEMVRVSDGVVLARSRNVHSAFHPDCTIVLSTDSVLYPDDCAGVGTTSVSPV